MKITLINLAYLLAAALFIFGLKRLQSPATARTGNLMAAIGMLIAIVVSSAFVPNMLQKGTLDLSLARPISRARSGQVVAALRRSVHCVRARGCEL